MSGPLRTLIVDDEAPARQLLEEFLADDSGVEVVASCANGFEAIQAVHEHAPDLMLLDVQMPKLDGFEVVELLGDDCPAVIFVTAYDEHALRAFEVEATDYLLKPVAADRLRESLARVAPRRPPPRPPAARRSGDAPVDRLLVRDGPRIDVVPVDRLDYVEAQDDVVVLVSGGRRHRKARTLTSIERSLDPRRFVRVHRSYLLNVERLARLELYAKDSRVAILRDGSRIPVSRAGYARLRELL